MLQVQGNLSSCIHNIWAAVDDIDIKSTKTTRHEKNVISLPTEAKPVSNLNLELETEAPAQSHDSVHLKFYVSDDT